MGLKWKNGRLMEDPPRTNFSRRELVVLSLFLPSVSSGLTAVIPDCYHYPKRVWGDWLVLVIMIAFVAACWGYTIWFWVYAARHYRQRE